MAIDFELYEDSGPITAGLRGTTRNLVTNIGWKADGTDDTGNHYAFSPIVRPQSPHDLWVCSYTKYHHLKLSGTYSHISGLYLKINNNVIGTPPAGYEDQTSLPGDAAHEQIRVYYRITSQYAQPTNVWDQTLAYLPYGTSILYPQLSLTGPEGDIAPSYFADNTTYYTQYLVTQLVVPYGTNCGNIGEVNIEWGVTETEG